MYKQTINPFTNKIAKQITRLSDNACIPFEPTSIDYQEYLDWLAEGNTPSSPDENVNEE